MRSPILLLGAAWVLWGSLASAADDKPPPSEVEISPPTGIVVEAPPGVPAEPPKEQVKLVPPDRKDDYRWSVSGHPYRVKYDPGSRVAVLAGIAGFHAGNGEVGAESEFGLWFGYRKVYAAGEGPGRITWQVDHQLVSGTIRPFRRLPGEIPTFDATLYRATLARHSAAPSLVLPVTPPVTLDFPFDVGLDAEIGRVTVPALPVTVPGRSGPGPWFHIGVVRTSFTLDPLRFAEPGRAFAIGLGVRYDIDVYPGAGDETPVTVHRIAPLTSASLRFRYQTDDGLLWIDAFAEAAPQWANDGKWRMMGSASFHIDRTLIALNDWPLGAYVDVGWRYLPDAAGAPDLHDIHGTLGVATSFPLR